jgi:predicted membrane metal-binding protein
MGYNIVIILNAFLIAGIAVGLWRRSATLVAFAGTVLFIFLIGSPASAVRAGIMGLAAFGAFLFGRVSYSLRALCLAGAGMVLWNPLVLWYDAGFQLSFLATVAVIGAMRIFEEKVPEGTRGKFLLEILWLTFWMYDQWTFLKNKQNLNISPGWRAFFSPLWAGSLAGHIQKYLKKENIDTSYSPILIGISFFILSALYKLPDPYWLITFLSFIPILPILDAMNQYYEKHDSHLPASELTWWQNILVGIGLFTIVAAFYGTIYP